MVNYINNDNIKNIMYSKRERSTRMGLGIVFLFISLILFTNLTIATDSLGVFRQNENIQLLQTCSICDYVTLDSVKLPNSTILLINQNMTQSGSTFYYYFNQTNLVGEYIYNTYFGNYTAPVSFEVNPNGKSLDAQRTTMQSVFIPLIVSLIGLILLAVSFAVGDGTSKVLRYSSIVVGALSLYLCFTLDADNFFSIMNAGIIAFGVGSLLDLE